MRRMADAMGEVSNPRAGVDRAALSTLPLACIIHAGSIRTQVYQVEKPTEGKTQKYFLGAKERIRRRNAMADRKIDNDLRTQNPKDR